MKRFLAGAALLAATAPVFAQGGGWFLDGSIGQMKAKLPDTTGFTVDNKDTTFSAGGGYMFNRYVGLEGGYRDLGEVSAAATATFSNARILGATVTGTGTLTVKGSADGFYFGPTFRLPVHESFDLTGRFGWYRSETPVTASISFVGTINGIAVAANGSGSKTFKHTDPYWGLGGTYNFNKNIGLGLEYSKYKLGGDVDTKLDLWSMRLTYRF